MNIFYEYNLSKCCSWTFFASLFREWIWCNVCYSCAAGFFRSNSMLIVLSNCSSYAKIDSHFDWACEIIRLLIIFKNCSSVKCLCKFTFVIKYIYGFLRIWLRLQLLLLLLLCPHNGENFTSIQIKLTHRHDTTQQYETIVCSFVLIRFWYSFYGSEFSNRLI